MNEPKSGLAPSADDSPRTLYRGVHANHPALAAARRGEVVPANLLGTVTPEEHNAGGYSHNSAYTSWCSSLQRAKVYAESMGPGGIVLRLQSGAPLPTDGWSWEWSPDGFGEGEILLRGFRAGATVIL